jgi:UDP-2-acetamido-3-amino-2,3-dideoxy-glucuronate N-acetyltransferase
MTVFIHSSSFVDDGSEIGEGTRIWHFSHVQSGARIGSNCTLGQNVNVGKDVVIGNHVKIQNNVSVYSGTIVEDYVFLGPSCVLTNVTNPRAEINRRALFERTLLRRGCTIGANATVVCGVEIGRYAFVAAGAVVTHNLPDYALAVGVPARLRGWMSRHGLPLGAAGPDGIMTCPESGLTYREVEPGIVRCLDVDEEDELSVDLTTGSIPYDDWRDAGGGTPK